MWCSWGSSTFVPYSFIHRLILFLQIFKTPPFLVHISWGHISHITCHMSHVTCHMSCVFFFGGGDILLVELVCEGFGFNGAYPILFTIAITIEFQSWNPNSNPNPISNPNPNPNPNPSPYPIPNSNQYPNFHYNPNPYPNPIPNYNLNQIIILILFQIPILFLKS